MSNLVFNVLRYVLPLLFLYHLGSVVIGLLELLGDLAWDELCGVLAAAITGIYVLVRSVRSLCHWT